jgi:DNA-binding IclR family transcriptional regulator
MQSLDRGLRILEYIAQRKGAGVTEISAQFGINKSTASRILATFASHDIVYKEAETQKYRLSIGPLLFSYRIISRNEIIDIARPILNKLVEDTGETAHLCTLQHGQVYVLDKVKNKRSRFMRDTSLPGTRAPFHSSAASKAILAYMPPDDAARLLESSCLDAFTSRTISDIDTLLAQFEHIRENGYALDYEEYFPGLVCMAVPVFDRYGYASKSISVSGDDDMMHDADFREEILPALMLAGKKLTREYIARAAAQD